MLPDIGDSKISSQYKSLSFNAFKKYFERYYTGDFEAAYTSIGGVLTKKMTKNKEGSN
jgi:hypothetical protein